MRSVRSDLRLKLQLSYAMVGLLTLLGLAFLGALAVEKMLVTANAAHLESLASSRKQEIESRLRAWKSELRLVASQTQLRVQLRKFIETGARATLQQVRRILSDAKSSVPTMRHLSIIGLDGTVIASTDEALEGKRVSKASEYVLGRKDPMVHGIFPDQSRTPTVSVTSPMVLDGSSVGIAWSHMTATVLDRIAGDYTGLGETGELLIASSTPERNAIVVAPARFDRKAAFTLTVSWRQSAHPLVKAVAGREESIVDGFTHDYRGADVIAVTRNIPEVNWGVVAKIDRDEVLKPMVRLRNRIAVLAIAILLLTICLAQFLSGRLTRSLGAAEKQTSAIIDAAADGIILIDARGRIIRFNEAAETIFGRAAADVLGKSVGLLMPKGRRDRYVRFLKSLLASRTERQNKGGEILGLHRDGHTISLEVSLSSMRLDKVWRITLIVRDVTDRKETEERMKSALRTEREANKLQQQFISMASHEFRTPLSVIDSIAQRLIRRPDNFDATSRTDKLLEIRGSVARLVSVIEGLLNLGRLEQGRIEPEKTTIDLKGLVTAAAETLRKIAPTHQIVMHTNDEPIRIVGDAFLLSHAVENLISNAVKFSPEAKRVLVSVTAQPGWAYVSVVDLGVGIPEDELGNIFDKYFRSSTASGIAGTGIGLNTVKKFVELHGGSIAVESVVGKGTGFVVALPMPDAGALELDGEDREAA